MTELSNTRRALRPDVARLEQRVDIRFESVDRRFELIDQKLSRQCHWIVGIQLTTLLGVAGGLFAVASALLSRA